MPLARYRRLALLFSALVLADCAVDNQVYQCEDGGDLAPWCRDAGSSSSDGATDSGPVVTDTADSDSSSLADAASIGDPDWTHFPDTPADCNLDVARHPANLGGGVPLLPTMTCGIGCRRTAEGGYPIQYAFTVEGRTLLVLRSADPGSQAYLYAYLVDFDGTFVAALRYFVNGDDVTVPRCSANVFAMQGSDLGVLVEYYRADATGDHFLEAWIRTYRARFDSVAETALRVSAETLDTSTGVHLATAMGLGADFATYTYVGTMNATVPGGGVRVVQPPLFAGNPFHVASDVFFTGATPASPQRVVLAQSIHGADASVIRGGGADGVDVVDLGSDGSSLAWLEGIGYDTGTDSYASLALYSGAYAAGTLTPHHVRDLAVTRVGASVVGGGYFVQDEDDLASGHHVFAVYRLSDGRRAVFDPPLGAAATALLVTSDQLICLGSTGATYRVDPRTLTYE